jgi:hypothetical protein
MDSSETEEEAMKKGDELLAMMKGDGWELSVHENMGWHYSVRNGPMQMQSSSSGGTTTYSILLGGSLVVRTAGVSHFLVEDWYADPNEAVEAQIYKAKEFVLSQVELLTHIIKCCV